MDVLDLLAKETTDEQPSVSPIADREENAGGDSESNPAQGNGQHSNASINLPETPSIVGSQNQPEIFNPDIHAVDADGLPLKNKNGKYSKKRGRKSGQTQQVTASIMDTDNAKLQKAHAAAVAVVQSLFILGSVIGGEEFRPIVDNEKGINEPLMLTQAWTEFFVTSDIESIPTWLGAAIATTAFFATRFTMPVTQSRLSSFWDWITSKFSREKKV